MSSGKGGAATAREAAAIDQQSQGRELSGQGTSDERDAGAPASQDGYRPPTVDAVAGEADREVARRAYELYLARGGEHGFDMDDWIQAENELRGRASNG